MRYETKFCNGHWVTFDTKAWAPVAAFGLRKNAGDHTDGLNGSRK